MGVSPILIHSIIYTVTFGTELNFNSGSNRHRLRNVTC